MTIKELVTRVLENYEVARNDDTACMCLCGVEQWTLTKKEARQLYKLLKKHWILQRTIRRERQNVQKERPDLKPTDPEVRKNRAKKEKLMRENKGSEDKTQEQRWTAIEVW